MKRFIRYAAVAALAVVLVGAAGTAGLLFFGPAYIERTVVPDIGRRMGVDEMRLDIRRIGLRGADIGALRIGEEDRPALTVGAALVDYAPGGLFRGRIEGIAVAGAEIFCGYENGAFYLRGLDFQDLLSGFGQGDTETPPDAPPSSVFPVGRIRVDNGVVVFSYNEEHYRLPFDVVVERDSERLHVVHGTLTLYPRGESVTVSGDVDLKKRTARARIDGKAIETSRFADLAGRVPELSLWGLLDLSGKGDFRLDPPAVDALSANLSYRSRRTEYAGVSLKSFDEGSEPLAVALDWGDAPTLHISPPPIRVEGPAPIELSGVQADVHLEETGLSVKGSGSLVVPKTPEDAEATPTVAAPLTLPLTFGADWREPEKQWRFRAASENRKDKGATVELAAGGATLSLAMDGITVNGAFGENGASMDCRMSVEDLTVSADGIRATFPKATVEGKARGGKDGRMSANGTVSISDGSLQGLGGKLRLERVAATLPLRWPTGEETDAGAIAIGSIIWDGRSLGALKGTVRQVAKGFSMSAEHWNLILSGMGVWVAGDFPVFSETPAENRFKLSASWPESSPDLELGKFLPSAKGIKINGDLSVEGEYRFGGGAGATGVLNADFKNGWLKKGGNGIAVEGVNGAVRFPHLPGVHSAPAQALTIRKAALGQVALTDAAIAFQLEPGGALLIEQSRFRWAGGKVSGHAVRIAPGTDVYDVVLYCDRLSLARVLQQFGAVEADGDGTVNGRVPVRLAKGKLTFDDGFLYSTPGDGGTIHVTGAEVLTAGIPKGSMQFSQIDLAREAMKEYRYEWARLRLNTEGEDLIMALHLDGKPLNPLPFVYKKEVGGFVRIAEDQVGSRFQGIRLDVNFRLPLNRILQYRDLF